jgi:hypothetical protein
MRGTKENLTTQLVPSNGPETTYPVSASHTLIVLSLDPEAIATWYSGVGRKEADMMERTTRRVTRYFQTPLFSVRVVIPRVLEAGETRMERCDFNELRERRQG